MASSFSSDRGEERNMIRLQSCDGEVFEVDEKVALLSQTIKYTIEDDCAKDVIPLHNVDAFVLSKVLEYCKKHALIECEGDLESWDAEFIGVGQDVLFDLMLAANYLEIKGLLDLASTTVATMMMGKTAEEIRAIFYIKNDFTPEEEEKVMSQNQWAFE